MNQLYSQLSEVYAAMYQSFINYEEEFYFYHQLLAKYHCSSVLEIGCGTGNLAPQFLAAEFAYTGLDLSDEMLSIAKKNHPSADFYKADMRNFALPKKISSAIITGRTISYLLTNEDVLNAFKSINKNLEKNGVLCFDFINAYTFIPRIKNGEEIIHEASHKNKSYQRKSLWTVNLQDGFTFNWASTYYEMTENGQLKELGQDNSVIRSFTKDEFFIFLSLAGFEIKEVIARDSYAFDTLVIVAQKITEL